MSSEAYPGAAGVDGFKAGWVAAVDLGEERTRIEFFDDFRSLLAEHDRTLGWLGGPVLIDIPIGLPGRGSRACDLEARRILGPRRNSVFAAPIREMLIATTHEEACAIGRDAEGRGLSLQAFAIMTKIAEVDRQMTPERQARIREGHPEVSFAMLAGGPLSTPKSEAAGKQERYALIASSFPDFESQAKRYAKRRVLVDILDAYALLWSARRVARGTARSIPVQPETDARGLRIEMVA